MFFPQVFPQANEFSWRQMSVRTIGAVLLVSGGGVAFAQDAGGACGLVVDTGNMYDYRPDKFRPNGTFSTLGQVLKLVEDAHFTRPVETLQRGHSGFKPGADISFTLRVFPNHHRALMAMAALGEKEKTEQPFESTYTVECWFRRAIVWRPDDNIARMLYSQYLFKAARENEAEQQLAVVDKQASDNPFTLHNIGLIYFDNKKFEKALSYAHRAYDLGLQTPTLREQLKRAGKWVEKTDVTPVDSTKATN